MPHDLPAEPLRGVKIPGHSQAFGFVCEDGGGSNGQGVAAATGVTRGIFDHLNFFIMALDNGDRDILLAKYVTGETNAAESAAAEKWIGASEENRSHVDRLCRIWRESQELGFKGTAD